MISADKILAGWIAGLLFAAPCAAAEHRAGGVKIELPAGWSRRGDVWVKTERGARVATLAVAATPASTEISTALLRRGLSELDTALRAGPEDGFAARSLEIAAVAGSPAYRVRASRADVRPGSAREQILYIVPAAGTVYLTYTTTPDRIAQGEEELRSLLATAAIEARDGAWDAFPASLGGSLLGVLAGLGAAGQWLRRRCARRGSARYSAPMVLFR